MINLVTISLSTHGDAPSSRLANVAWTVAPPKAPQLPLFGLFRGVKRKSLIFFIWRKSLFFFRRKSNVGNKTRKCMVRDLRFFCDATYT